MSDTDLSDYALRVSDLRQNRETSINLRPTSDEMKEIANDLDLLGLRKLSFSGFLIGEGKDGWRLEGKLGATVTQPCVVTLEPVVTRLDESVLRRFVREMPEQESVGSSDEVETLEDDSLEQLGTHIDPYMVMTEALALALPFYPRREGADLGEAVFTKPGETPLQDKDTKPFAGLAELRDKLKKEP